MIDQRPASSLPTVTVACANAGTGGLGRHLHTLLHTATLHGVHVLVVGEAFPTRETFYSMGDAAAGWRWLNMSQSLPYASRSTPQERGETVSGGVVILVNQALPCVTSPGEPDLWVTAVEPVVTPAATVGDAAVVEITLASRSADRGVTAVEHRLIVAGIYLRPLSGGRMDPTPSLHDETGAGGSLLQRGTCRLDTADVDGQCDLPGVCIHQHPLRCTRLLLNSLKESAAADTSPTVVLVGDLNAHLVGPTAGQRGGARRERALRALFDEHAFEVVNDAVECVHNEDGTPTLPADPQTCEVTHRCNNNSGHPATLDYVLVPRGQLNRVVRVKVHDYDEGGAGPDDDLDDPIGGREVVRSSLRDLDHRFVTAVVRLRPVPSRRKDKEREKRYRPTPGARDVPVQRRDRERYDPRPSDDPDLRRGVRGMVAALAAEVNGRVVEAGTHTGAFFLPAVGTTEGLFARWTSAAEMGLKRAGLLRRAATRMKFRSVGTLEGETARALRVMDRVRRQVQELEASGEAVPDELLAEVSACRDRRNRLRRELRREWRVRMAVQRQQQAELAGHPQGIANQRRVGRAVSSLAATRKSTQRSSRPQHSPASINHARSRRDAVKEWVVELRRAAQQRRQRGDDPRFRQKRERFHQLYERLERSTAAGSLDFASAEAGGSELGQMFTAEEMRAALCSVREEATTQGVPTAILKAMVAVGTGSGVQEEVNPVLPMLTGLANAWLAGHRLPDELTTLRTVFVHKRGEPHDFSSWRLITPGHSVLWTLLNAINRRLCRHLELSSEKWRLSCAVATGTTDEAAHPSLILSDTQSGFRAGRSVFDNLVLADEIVNRAAREGKRVAEIYVDVKSAFDNVLHPSLGVSLWDHGVRGRFWYGIMRLLTEEMGLRVGLGGLLCPEKIRLGVGTSQGTPISPTLYIVAVTEISARARVAAMENAAVRWRLPVQADGGGMGCVEPDCGCHARLGHGGLVAQLSYADDDVYVLTAENGADLIARVKKVVAEVDEAFADVGLPIGVAAARQDEAGRTLPPNKTAWAVNLGSSRAPASAPAREERQMRAAAERADIKVNRWAPNGGERVPLLGKGDLYTYLGVPRSVQVNGRYDCRRALDTVRGCAERCRLRARAALGRMISAGVERLPLRAARKVYQCVIPSITYGLLLWCHRPADVERRVEGASTGMSISQLHVLCVRAVAGHGRVHGLTAIPAHCLQPAMGVVPIWAVALRQQCSYLASVLARHPYHAVRAALRAVSAVEVVGDFARIHGNSWVGMVTEALEKSLPGGDGRLDYQYLGQDLLYAGMDDRDERVWTDDGGGGGGAAGRPHNMRSRAFLGERVDDIIKNWWALCRNQQGAVAPWHPGFTPTGYSPHSGSTAYSEVNQWLGRAVPGRPFPLIDGRRGSEATSLRILALGGLAGVIRLMNWPLLRDRPSCVLCGETWPGVETGTTLTHVIGECPRLEAQRRRCWEDLLQELPGVMSAGDELLEQSPARGLVEALSPLVGSVLDPGRDAIDGAVQLMVALCLGVPANRCPARKLTSVWYAPGRGSTGGEWGRRVRATILESTAPLVVEALKLAQRETWKLSGATLPRQAVAERAAAVARAQRDVMRRRFRAGVGPS